MDKQKVIKIAIAAIIGVFAVVYYFVSNKQSDNYENILTNEIVIENTIEEPKEEEKVMIKVYVTGEVNSPGVVELEEGARIQDAIEAVGGITPEANIQDVNLAYEVSDGEKIYIPNLMDSTGEVQLESGVITGNNSVSNGKVNINKATAAELTTVPGIGASTAEKIIAYREENGKFKSIEDIQNVTGIGASKYEKLKEYICVK